MSNVVKAISVLGVTEHGVVPQVLFNEMFDADARWINSSSSDAKTYQISVTLGARVTISDMLQKRDANSDLSAAVERTKKQVIEAIFGEFRTDFRMIEKAIYDRDMNKALDSLYSMERKMFET